MRLLVLNQQLTFKSGHSGQLGLEAGILPLQCKDV